MPEGWTVKVPSPAIVTVSTSLPVFGSTRRTDAGSIGAVPGAVVAEDVDDGRGAGLAVTVVRLRVGGVPTTTVMTASLVCPSVSVIR